MSTTVATDNCSRCGHPLELDAVQCENCGEVHRQGNMKLRRAALVKELLSESRAEKENQRRSAHSDDFGIAIPRPPYKKIAVWTGRIIAVLWLGAALTFGLAWTLDRHVVALVDTCTFLVGAGVVTVFLGIATATAWTILHSIELIALSISENRAAARQEKARLAAAQAAEAAVKEKARRGLPEKDRTAHYNFHLRDMRARRPSPWTLSFSIIGVVTGALALLFAVIPLFGLFAFFPLVPAICFSVIALALALYERSQKLMPVLGMSLTAATLLTIAVQAAFWTAAEEAIEREQARQHQELKREIQHTVDKIVDLIPSLPPTATTIPKVNQKFAANAA